MLVSKISFRPFVSSIRTGFAGKDKNFVKTNPIPYDTFTHTGRNSRLLSAKDGLEASEKYKKSTSGYRGTYGEKFNSDFVYTMTNAFVKYCKDNNIDTTMIGGDTRIATKEFIPEIVDILTDNGLHVYIPKFKKGNEGEYTPVASPALAVSTMAYAIPLSILMTASHNPWKDGGYNFLTQEGAVADNRISQPIAENIASITSSGKTPVSPLDKGFVTEFDPYEIYKSHIEKNKLIDFEKIRNAHIEIFYDGLGGCGNYYFPRLLKDNGVKLAKKLDSITEGPEPNAKNLKNLATEVAKSDKALKVGLATDGDSDRFGIIDENGNFISADDVLTLVSYHMIKNLGMNKGTLIRNCSSSQQLDFVAKYFNKLNPEKYDIKLEETPVGFKYLGGKMLELEGTEFETIIAGEQSGGLAVRNHIPEKDGFVAIAKILELMACEKKPIGVILKEVKEKIGADYNYIALKYAFEDESLKEDAVKYFDKYFNGKVDNIAGYKIDLKRTREADNAIRKYKPDGDGTKLYLECGITVLIRKSGTEPILRVSIDSNNIDAQKEIHDELSGIIKDLGGIEKH